MQLDWDDQAQHSQAWIWVGGVLALILVMLALVSRPSHIEGGINFNQANLIRLTPADAKGPQLVQLPHVWDDEDPPLSGLQRYQLVWPENKNADKLKAVGDEGWSLLMTRVGARFQVRLDEVVIYSEYWDTLDYVDTSVVPHIIALPLDFDPRKGHTLDVDVQGILLRKSGLGPVLLAPTDQVRDRYGRLIWWQVYLTWMVAACSGMLSLIAGLVWWSVRERAFAWLAIASAAWMVRLTLTPLVHPGMPFELWFFLHKFSFTVYCGFIYLFIWELFKIGQHHARSLVKGLLWISPVYIAGVLWLGEYDAYRLWTGLFALISIATLGRVLIMARWGMDPARRLMVVVCLVTLITGLRDFLVVQFGVIGDADLRWMTPGSLVFMLTLSLMLVHRMNRYVVEIKKLNDDLVIRVQDKERELHEVFARVQEADKQKVLISERARLTRDMHDGLGSQLVQTLNAVRGGTQLPMSHIEQMLTHALEELRMTIDSMETMEGDLPTILGTLRRRIGTALDAAQIELEWAVEDVPALLDAQGKPLEAKSVMHLFRCLQEVFANIIKHAKADRVRVQTSLAPEGVVLDVVDNGQGMQRKSREGGLGLDNVRLRAAALGAHVYWHSSAQGTHVQFVFPLHAGKTGEGYPF
jgi:signal transduction histidine kinase